MDKFGIFKLLNSLFNFYVQKNDNSSGEKEQDFNNIFKGVVAQQNTPVQERQKAEDKKPFAPLQTQMLTTMLTHEEFVRRVKNKNPSP